MPVLLSDDVFQRYVPDRGDDGHGWATEGEPTLAGTVTGCLQIGNPHVDNQFMGEGFGQNEPHFLSRGVAYLNESVDPGDRLLDDVGDMWLVDDVRIMQDHTGSGLLDCWVAHLTFVDVD